MTYSPLTTGKVLTNNHGGRRKHAIDTLTPHYMCWYTDGKTCAESFLPASRQASANYCIGRYGDVILGVDENNCSWCSGTWSKGPNGNDQRAITIECANYMETANGHVYGQLPDATWDRLVALCADICKRYGFKGAQYVGSADYSKLKSGYMLLTKHKWFQNTDCPGPWLDGQFDRLAKEINARLGNKEATVSTTFAAEQQKLRDKLVKAAESQLGVRYFSLHTGPKGSGDEGWGCAALCRFCYEQVFGVKGWTESTYNFLGDALDDPNYNQGGGEFVIVSEADAHAGDVVCYCPSGFTGKRAVDVGHVAILVSETEVIGAMGHGKPGESGYLNIGVSKTKIYGQSLGGPVIYLHSKRLDRVAQEAVDKANKRAEAKKAPTAFSAKLYNANNTPMQHWNVHKSGDLVRLCNVGRKMFLDVRDAAKADGTPVRVAKETKGDGQLWRLVPRDVPYGRYYELEPKCAPGMRLDAKDGGTAPKTGLQIHKRNGTPAQLWCLVDSEDGNLRIVSVKSGLAIDAGDGVQ